MTELSVKTREGQAISVPVERHATLMEALRDAGCDELLALCGGSCSCATCHVFLDAESFARLDPMSADENELLDSASCRTALSRLSCQVPLYPGMPNMTVEIAPED